MANEDETLNYFLSLAVFTGWAKNCFLGSTPVDSTNQGSKLFRKKKKSHVLNINKHFRALFAKQHSTSTSHVSL